MHGATIKIKKIPYIVYAMDPAFLPLLGVPLKVT
jgi:hypothetical protein